MDLVLHKMNPVLAHQGLQVRVALVLLLVQGVRRVHYMDQGSQVMLEVQAHQDRRAPQVQVLAQVVWAMLVIQALLVIRVRPAHQVTLVRELLLAALVVLLLQHGQVKMDRLVQQGRSEIQAQLVQAPQLVVTAA